MAGDLDTFSSSNHPGPISIEKLTHEPKALRTVADSNLFQ